MPDAFNTELEVHWRHHEEADWSSGSSIDCRVDALRCMCGVDLEECGFDNIITVCSWCWGRVSQEEEAPF